MAINTAYRTLSIPELAALGFTPGARVGPTCAPRPPRVYGTVVAIGGAAAVYCQWDDGTVTLATVEQLAPLGYMAEDDLEMAF
jgi:hypothetical protein